jgi:quercetin dioxygenase-like cupin family protein
MFRALGVVILVLVPLGAFAQDALVTDPDKYKLVLENERVRVLEYRDKPGDKTKQHSHPDFVLYTLSAFKRRLTLGDGRTLERTAAPGQTGFTEAQIHIGENVGDTDTHVLMVELKEPRRSKKAPK